MNYADKELALIITLCIFFDDRLELFQQYRCTLNYNIKLNSTDLEIFTIYL